MFNFSVSCFTLEKLKTAYFVIFFSEYALFFLCTKKALRQTCPSHVDLRPLFLDIKAIYLCRNEPLLNTFSGVAAEGFPTSFLVRGRDSVTIFFEPCGHAIFSLDKRFSYFNLLLLDV